MQKRIIESADDFDAVVGRLVRRFAYVRKRNMRHFAARFCEHFGLDEPPRNPFRILPEVFGIRLERVCLPRTTPAEWIRVNGNYVIRYSAHRPHDQLALTLWHELAEIVFANPRFPSRYTTDQECDLAMLFAVNVMLPEDYVRAAVEEIGHSADSDKTVNLAAGFGVSRTAMRVRLGELGLLPSRYGQRYRWIKVPV